MSEGLDTTLETLARRFRRFGERECAAASPLYARLAVGIADDPALLQVAAAAQAHPVPNLFFGAVQYLLLKESDHPLAAFYPGIGADPPLPPPLSSTGGAVESAAAVGAALPFARAVGKEGKGDPFPLFRAFCLAHVGQIRELLTTRRVQTNEVRRCACLMPAFVLAARRAPGRALALVEIGASAGFNLLWDRYGYDYGAGVRAGHALSPLQLACELRGDGRLPLVASLPDVVFRVGLDLNPIDVRDADAMLWLRALIWPEQQDRAALLAQAIQIARQNPPLLLAGDALDLLPSVLARVPTDVTLCIYHTFTLNQFAPEARERFHALIAERAAQRDLCMIAIEWREPYPSVVLTSFVSGARSDETLAHCDAHGAWMEWLR